MDFNFETFLIALLVGVSAFGAAMTIYTLFYTKPVHPFPHTGRLYKNAPPVPKCKKPRLTEGELEVEYAKAKTSGLMVSWYIGRNGNGNYKLVNKGRPTTPTSLTSGLASERVAKECYVKLYKQFLYQKREKQIERID